MDTAQRERWRGKGFGPSFWFVLAFLAIALFAVTTYGLVQYQRRNSEARANVERARQRVEEIKHRREDEERERQARLEKALEESKEKAHRDFEAWYMERIRAINEPK